MKTRSDLARLVPPGGLMIELGVAAGKFAEELLRVNPKARYVGIDRWSDHHNEEEMKFADLRTRGISRYAPHFMRCSFRDGAIVFQRSADLIYIDGYAHTGQEGGETLRDWWPKLKPGGIFAGHDYDDEYPLTVAAVDAFVAEHGLQLNVISEKPNSSWWVKKTSLNAICLHLPCVCGK